MGSLFNLSFYPLRIILVRFDFEFDYAGSFVGVDLFDFALNFFPIHICGFDERHDFFAVFNFSFPPIGTLDREIVHASDQSFLEQNFRHFFGSFNIRISYVD